MKICAIICEFNPFHNGHAYLLNEARKITGCDAVLCLMSGSFTQRGDMAVMDKYKRAEHALYGGADCVIQLPVSFAVSPAEIFASGAVKILNSIPDVKFLVFGSESGETDKFKYNSEILLKESTAFKEILNERLKNGESYIKSYASAFETCGGDRNFIQNPNNILGLEYVKALKKINSDIKPLTVKRCGSGYNDVNIKNNFSSASAIRNNLNGKEVETNVPDFVYRDLKHNVYLKKEYENFLRYCLFNSAASELKKVFGCGEGLENKLKKLQNLTFEELISNASCARYPYSRIRRILCANALKLYETDVKTYLDSDLYIKPLSVKKDLRNSLLAALSKSSYPLIDGADSSLLYGNGKSCFESDLYAYSAYKFITNSDRKDYMSII